MSSNAIGEADHLRARLPSFRRKLDSARQRVQNALASIDQPYVAFSGGKDSLVVLALVAEQRPGIVAIWSDDELEYPEQLQYIPVAVEQLGVTLICTLGWAEHAGWFRPWQDRPFWREPLPGSLAIGQPVETWSMSAGYDGYFLGLRRQESARRRTHLAVHSGLYCTTSGQWRCNPIAGWSVDDVWAAIVALDLPVNPVYDRLAEVGIARDRQRIGPLPLSPGWILRAAYPALARALIERYGPQVGWSS